MTHSWTHIVRALVLACLASATLRAQTPRGQFGASADASVLRLMSGSAGIEPSAEPPSLPTFMAEEPPTEVAADTEVSPRWANPHEIGDDSDAGPLGQFPRLRGIIPSCHGPRTPMRFRYSGEGNPLMGASWINRPLSAGWFAGIVNGSPLIVDHVHQGVGFFGGYRLGWDYDYYWGLETRIAGAAIPLFDDTHPTVPRTGDLVQWDADLLYYPWGDSRWRPYFMLGSGVAVFHFSDDTGAKFRKGTFALPWGVGLKYRVDEYFVARVDLIDNVAFAAGPVDTMNNISLTFSVEVRFGGVRRHYWPWNPGRHLW